MIQQILKTIILGLLAIPFLIIAFIVALVEHIISISMTKK